MGYVIAWVLWLGSLECWDWVLYSEVDGAMNYIPYPSEVAGWIWEHAYFII